MSVHISDIAGELSNIRHYDFAVFECLARVYMHILVTEQI